MFPWSLSSQSTRIKEILNSGNFTIEDLLLESYDIVVSAANDPVVYNQLKEPVLLVQLFDYVLKEPVKRDDVLPEQIPELQRQLLLSTTACDTIAQSTHLLEAIIKDVNIMEIIFKGFKEFRSHLVFHRLTTLFMAIFSIGASELIINIKAHQPDFLRNLVMKIGIAPTEDIVSLLKLFLRSNAKVPGVIEWLANEQLIRLLISNFSHQNSDIICRETVIVLQEVTNDILIKSQLSEDHDTNDDLEINFSSSEDENNKPNKTPNTIMLIYKQYEEAETLDLLFACLFSSPTAQIFGLPFIMNIVSQNVFPALQQKCLIYLDHFLNILKPVKGENHQLLPSPAIHPDIGLGRTTTIKFLILLLKLDNSKITTLLIEKESFTILLEVLFIHRNNTVLHNLILEYFTIGLTRIQYTDLILSTTNLLGRITDAWNNLIIENEARLKDQALYDHALSYLKKLFRNFKHDRDLPVEVAVKLQIIRGSQNWGCFGHLFKLANIVVSIFSNNINNTHQIPEQNSPNSQLNPPPSNSWNRYMENEQWKKFVDEVLKVYNSISSQKLGQECSSDSQDSSEDD